MRPTLSVVVPSRGRAWSLSLTLAALKAQRGLRPEIVVVSDSPVSRDLEVAWLRQPQANIARSRNVGLARARGDVIAFCDDDAIPEPGWAEALLAGMERGAAAIGGPVLGRDGVRVQWGEMHFDDAGRDIVAGPYRKLNGTNFAVARSWFEGLGGFDERFAYYLDETDLLRRIARADGDILWSPDAVVHHATAPNSVRGSASTPAGFRQLGHSFAAFTDGVDAMLQQEGQTALEAEQRRRLLRMHDIGTLSGTAVAARLAALREGFGVPTGPAQIPVISEAKPLPVQDAVRPERILLAPRIAGRRAARHRARELVRDGNDVTLIVQTWLNRPMRVSRHPDGYWLHRGGVFRGGNSRPYWRAMLQREINRIAHIRAFDTVWIGTRRGGWRRTKPSEPPSVST